MSVQEQQLDHLRIATLLRGMGLAPAELRGSDWGSLEVLPALTPAQVAALKTAYADPAQAVSQRQQDLAVVQAALPIPARAALARLLGMG